MDPEEAKEIESGIRIDLEERFSDLLSQSVTVHLFNDIPKSVISGMVVNADNKRVIKIVRRPYENKTNYDLMPVKK